jgi:hypothetical protein
MKYFSVEVQGNKLAVAADSEDAAYSKLCATFTAMETIPRELFSFTEIDTTTASETGLIGEDEK